MANVKIKDEYELCVCEFCGTTAERDKTFDSCECCNRTMCIPCKAINIILDEKEKKKQNRDYIPICKVCKMHGAEQYAFHPFQRCNIHV